MGSATPEHVPPPTPAAERPGEDSVANLPAGKPTEAMASSSNPPGVEPQASTPAPAPGAISFTVEGPPRPHPVLTEPPVPGPGKKFVPPNKRGHAFKNTMDRTGRPGLVPGVTIHETPNGIDKYEFDEALIEGLGRIGANDREIAAITGASESTIKTLFKTDTPFRRAYDRGLAEICQSLRRKQISMALKGNVKMLTWLGMQLLGQRNVARAEIGSPTAPTLPGEGETVFTLVAGSDENGRPFKSVTPADAEPDAHAAGTDAHPAASGEPVIEIHEAPAPAK